MPVWALSRQQGTRAETAERACLLDPVGSREKWCPEEDSNLHSLRNTDLNRARLPIPPSGLVRAHVSGQAIAVNALFSKVLRSPAQSSSTSLEATVESALSW